MQTDVDFELPEMPEEVLEAARELGQNIDLSSIPPEMRQQMREVARGQQVLARIEDDFKTILNALGDRLLILLTSNDPLGAANLMPLYTGRIMEYYYFSRLILTVVAELEERIRTESEF